MAVSFESLLLDVLPSQDILALLALPEIGQLLLTSRSLAADLTSPCLRRELLSSRQLPPALGWWQAAAAEAALFRDGLAEGPLRWSPGPNLRCACNVLQQKGGSLWLSGGTDWQGFQGAFRKVSQEGIRPRWVSFTVRVATPELSGACLTLAHEQRTWGMAEPLLVFGYRGDDCSGGRRFSLQPNGAVEGVDVAVEDATEAHEVALRLDWSEGEMLFFLDGRLRAGPLAFRKDKAVRFAALHNARSGARTAFAELLLGDRCPCRELRSAEPRRPRLACARRRGGKARPWALVGAALSLAAAVACRWVV